MENLKQVSSSLSLEAKEDKALRVYHGYGNHDLDGNVIYNISLPPIAEGNINIQKIIELPNNVLFIWAHGGTKPYTNPTDNMITLHFNMYDYMPRVTATKEFYLIHFFHEDSMLETDVVKDVLKLITDHCPAFEIADKKYKVDTIPEQCGNGVLTLQ